jgi:hypothetical protein
MCQPCFGDYLEVLSARLSEVDYDKPDGAGPDSGAVCAFCGEQRNNCPTAIFVTAYPPKAQERSFYGRVCRDCETAAKAEILLS